MKKTYQKPMVYIEEFSLSANIAAGCGAASIQGGSMGKPNSGSPLQCAWTYGGIVMAFSSETACGDKYIDVSTDDEALNSVFVGCYNSGADDVRLFTS